MQIRKAVGGDVEGLAYVHVQSWQTAYRGIIDHDFLDQLSLESRLAQWERTLKHPEALVLVAENSAKQIVGFVSGGRERTNDPIYTGEIYALYLLANIRRQGVGRHLVSSFAKVLQEQGINSIKLWVLEQNPARKFYESLGGEFLGNEKTIVIGTQQLQEVDYGWTDTAQLVGEREAA